MSLFTGILLALAAAAVAALITALWLRRMNGAGPGDAGRVALLEQSLVAEQATRQQLEAALKARETELAARQAELQSAANEVRSLSVRTAQAESAAENHFQTIEALRAELADEKRTRHDLLIEQTRLSSELAGTLVELRKEREGAQEKLNVLNEARDQLTHQFRSLANDILEEKSQKFAEQNKTSLDQLLLPLKDQLAGFKTTVERVYIEEGKERTALAEQVKQLHALNAQLSADATGLTNALKGSSQRQGSWGEMVLERILESSGLRKGHEYRVQESQTSADGSRDRPDVILNLPEGKHLVIDSKNSLLDYNDHVNARTEAEREAAANRHIASIRTHINGLSRKDYRSLHSLKTVDFVIMFIPIEPAFMLAIGQDPNLWTHAWDRNVLLVSPSTLLFVVRTVTHLWNQEKQKNQWQEIADQGGKLYDKFSDFVGDLSKLGDQLKLAQKSYDAAFNKLSTGTGNLIDRADKLQKMGLKVKKPLPEKLVQGAAETDGPYPDLLSEDSQNADEHESPMLLELAAFSEDPGRPTR
jgi:DNA recombination protein RmuC